MRRQIDGEGHNFCGPFYMENNSEEQKKQKIVFVAGVHGNELMPIVALTQQGIPFVLANEAGVLAGIRFLEEDLNAAFGVDHETYEAKRAKELLEIIPPDSKVIDFHSAPVETQPFAIIVSLAMLSLARTLGVRHVVYMKYNVKAGHALINHRDGVSIEVGNHGDVNAVQRTIKYTENVCGDEHPVILYEVYDRMLKPGNYVNFQEYQDGDETFIPVLAGNRPYHGGYGLKARVVEQPKE
ncbi:MAG TPA: succinylglutamate desuccinylase/aspartoacylase family protein [Patescibacteria group bacterium]|nr:succinylglutamate desuccinylase/aspartoacylase family protein [Patescibacteria group bacterium]